MQGLLLALVPLFIIVDPFASLGLFLGLTPGHTRAQRLRVALRASLFAALVLVVFAIAGKRLLTAMGIELYSLRAAGGLLLVIIGLRMLREGEEIPHGELPTGGTFAPRAGARAGDPSFVPLGLPMLAGPGAISLSITLATEFGVATILAAIGIVMLASFLILLAAARSQRYLGETGTRVVTRIMGILTVAFAAQYLFDGITEWLAARAA